MKTLKNYIGYFIANAVIFIGVILLLIFNNDVTVSIQLFPIFWLIAAPVLGILGGWKDNKLALIQVILSVGAEIIYFIIVGIVYSELLLLPMVQFGGLSLVACVVGVLVGRGFRGVRNLG